MNNTNTTHETEAYALAHPRELEASQSNSRNRKLGFDTKPTNKYNPFGNNSGSMRDLLKGVSRG